MHTILSSATKTVRIGDDQPFAIIGERINPTGRKIFQLQLRNGDLSRVEIDVKEQVDGGAMLLDVNMGAPLADEAALMTRAVTLIQELTDLPLVIDSSIVEVLEAGLAAYQGKALVNSVTAEDDRLAAIECRSGMPKLTLDAPSVMLTPNSALSIAMVSSVRFGCRVSAPTGMASGSMTMSSMAILFFSVEAWMSLRASSTRRAGSSGISSSSLGRPMTAAPYFLTSGRMASSRSSSAVTELTSALPW